MDKKIFFFDLDNTLIPWPAHKILDSTMKTLKVLAEKGNLLAIATGRIQQDAVKYAEMANIDNIVADGGYSVTMHGDLVHMWSLEISECRKLLRQLEENEIPWAIVLNNKIQRFTPHEKLKERRVAPWDYFETVHRPGLDFEKIDDIYKIFIYLSEEDEEKYNIDYGQLDHVRYGEESILIEPMDKSRGIRYIADCYDIDYKNVVTFGDGKNDIGMFQAEWTNIAMGNSYEKLKELADYVTSDADKDGICKACLHYGWVTEEELESCK